MDTEDIGRKKGIDPLEAKRRTCRKRQREAEGFP